MPGCSLPGSSADRLSDLLGRASLRDARAFSELHALTKNTMRKTAYAAGAPLADIDDILQEAYLKIWRNANSFDCSRASAIAWMRTIVRNTAIDTLRARRLPTSDLEQALSVACPAEPVGGDDFDFERAQPIASRVLASLPKQRRELIALAYIEGESRVTLSGRFGVPVGTIKTWLHRTMEAVRKDCLAAAQPLDGGLVGVAR